MTSPEKPSGVHTGSSETGSSETGSPETGSSETGSPETGSPETGSPETGSPETGSPVTGPRRDTPAIEAPPVRATWSARAPEGPWCPDEWLPHLDAVAPGLRPPAETQEQVEATGTRAASAGWSLLLAARRGRLHAHRGEHREDAGTVLTFSGGWCAAVADGAGSATYSRLGSAIATHAATHALRDAVQHGTAPAAALEHALDVAARAANDSMRRFAQLTSLALRDLRTTLLLVVWHAGRVGSLQVGDGAIAMLAADDRVTLPHLGDSGDFSGEVTHFLPDDGAIERLLTSRTVQPTADVTGILLASDGVEDPWYPFARNAAPLLVQLRHGVHDTNASTAGVTQSMRGPVLAAADPVHALIEWLAFEKRGENDDRTLFVAWASSPSV